MPTAFVSPQVGVARAKAKEMSGLSTADQEDAVGSDEDRQEEHQVSVLATVSIDSARKVLTTVDAGLCSGLGTQVPGQMRVEAAVCFALGLPHGDEAPCVGRAVRRFNIRLNDSRWPSNGARAAGMRRLAIAQLGSNEIHQGDFARLLAEKTIRVVVPIYLRAAAKKNPKRADALEAAAKRCESEGTRAAAINAREATDAATAAATAAATYATYAATYATAAATYAATYAATAAAGAGDDADDDARHKALRASARIAEECLRELKCPGIALLDELLPEVRP